MKLYGVVVECSEGHAHLVSAEKDYMEAWKKAWPYGADDSATTVRIGANARVVRELRAKEEGASAIRRLIDLEES